MQEYLIGKSILELLELPLEDQDWVEPVLGVVQILLAIEQEMEEAVLGVM